MATSNSGARPSGENRPESTLQLSRYDILLVVIPTAFVLALFATQVLGLPTLPSIAAASTVGIFAVADGLFVNPPHRPNGR